MEHIKFSDKDYILKHEISYKKNYFEFLLVRFATLVLALILGFGISAMVYVANYILLEEFSRYITFVAFIIISVSYYISRVEGCPFRHYDTIKIKHILVEK